MITIKVIGARETARAFGNLARKFPQEARKIEHKIALRGRTNLRHSLMMTNLRRITGESMSSIVTRENMFGVLENPIIEKRLINIDQGAFNPNWSFLPMRGWGRLGEGIMIPFGMNPNLSQHHIKPRPFIQRGVSWTEQQAPDIVLNELDRILKEENL